ncbi:MAG: 8-oxoguanine DNA glycosylase [Clostridiales bacterium]|nr:8-oxoguanine DNA glycosylase [Clostridiales bacterium]
MITTIFQDNKAYITGEKIDPAIVFDCGQCFRFEKTEDVFHGIAYGQELFCKNEGNAFVIWPVTEDSFHKIWRQYFDLDYDYNEIDNRFLQDEILAKTVIKGMRILHQDPFETLISFIISANNNIKRIKKNIDMICRAAGKKIGEDLYAFPTPEELAKLSINDLRELGLGYRAPYIAGTTKQILDGFSLEKIGGLTYADAKKALMGLSGVGPKVADCILLFGFGKREAFPKDVWMRRILLHFYQFEPKNEKELEAFAKAHFPEFAGLAQQYLFTYARQNNISF